MFTGLIQEMGVVRDISHAADKKSMRAVISYPNVTSSIPIGASISCSGCCLTVTDISEEQDNTAQKQSVFSVDISSETLNRTNLNTWKIGDCINLERSLQLQDELGGHFVFGHVDGLAKLVSKEPTGQAYILKFEYPSHLDRYLVEKGSVCLDGISLTVNALENNILSVCIIPHTWSNTSLQNINIGDQVNMEIDMMARYVEKQMMAYQGNQETQEIESIKS